MRAVVVLVALCASQVLCAPWNSEADSSLPPRTIPFGDFTTGETTPTTTSAYPATTPGAPTTVDRECACTVSKIWLDVAVIVDVSEAMGSGLYEVAADLATVFGQMSVSQKHGQFSRVALVSAAGTATKISDLTTYGNTEALMNDLMALQAGTDKFVNIQAALQTASDIFAKSRSQRNRKQVVLLYASAYNQGGFEDPLETAIQIRDSGISIVTVAYVQASETNDVLKISELASPGYGFSNVQNNDLVHNITDTFCQINCFCRTNWAQFSDAYNTPGARVYGVCVQYVGIEASWFAANNIGCRNKANGGYLVTEYSDKKHAFNRAYYTDARNHTSPGASLAVNYHIGLRTNVPNSQGYVWVQGNKKYLPLDPNAFHAWRAGFPNGNLGDCVSAKQNGFLVNWQNVNCFAEAQNYMCESTACDTDNYCDNLD